LHVAISRRAAGEDTGTCTLILSRATASWNACWMEAVGAPSPIWQHGAADENGEAPRWSSFPGRGDQRGSAADGQ